jgi:hypothetical protein
MTEPIALVTGPTDKEIAECIKKDLIDTSAPMLKVLTNAARDGFSCNIAFGPNTFGEVVITGLVVAKHY